MEGGPLPDLQGWMIRLADGDRSAFHPVFETLWPVLRRLTARHLPAADAEDAAQEALIKIFRRAAEFDPTRSALAWSLGIAAYEIRTARRLHQRRREGSTETETFTSRRDAGPNPEEALLARDVEEMLQAALGMLRPEDSETLRLYSRSERPAVAATFRKRVERALARLRAAWRTSDGSP
jgi:RNA polymerase sigma-70 factor (ECF subfamily)